MSNDVMDWKIKMINPTDYELNMVFQSEHTTIGNLFNHARAALIRKKNISVKGSIEVIDKFEVPPEYLNTIKTFIRPLVAKIRKQINQDKIEILSWDIRKSWFERKGDKWNIVVELYGTWVDKR